MELVEGIIYSGGGSLPDQAMKSWAVAVEAIGDAGLARRLRLGTPAVMARLRDAKMLFDVRTIFAPQEWLSLAALQAALSEVGGREAFRVSTFFLDAFAAL